MGECIKTGDHVSWLSQCIWWLTLDLSPSRAGQHIGQCVSSRLQPSLPSAASRASSHVSSSSLRSSRMVSGQFLSGIWWTICKSLNMIRVEAGLLIWGWPFLARRDGPPSGGLCGPYVARLAAKQTSPIFIILIHQRAVRDLMLIGHWSVITDNWSVNTLCSLCLKIKFHIRDVKYVYLTTHPYRRWYASKLKTYIQCT